MRSPLCGSLIRCHMFEERSGIITISTVGKVSHLICLGRKHWSHFASFRLLPWDFGTAPRYTKAISKRGVKMLAIRKLSKYEFSGVEKHCPPPNLQGHRPTAPKVRDNEIRQPKLFAKHFCQQQQIQQQQI